MKPKKSRCRLRRRRLKPNIPTSLDDIDGFASHLGQLSCVLDMLKTIMATTKDIVQEAEGESAALPTLTRVLKLSTRLQKDVLPFAESESIIPSFKGYLEAYDLILFDIRDSLNANHDIVDYDAINHCLDKFLQDFEGKPVLHARNEQLPSGSASILQNSHNVTISGGTFNATSIQVVSDAAVPDQSRKILWILYIQCGVLFV